MPTLQLNGPEAMLDDLFGLVQDTHWERHFQLYRRAKENAKQVQAQLAQLLNEEAPGSRFARLSHLSVMEFQLLLQSSPSANQSPQALLVLEFLNHRLPTPEWAELLRYPQQRLAQALGKGLQGSQPGLVYHHFTG